MAQTTEYINNTNLSEWQIDDTELCKYIIPPYSTSGGALPLYIPKLMPNISMGKPTTFTVGLNKSCYCNSGECKPPVTSSLTGQNFITVQPLDNRGFALPHFYYGTTIYVEVHNKNVDELYITTKVDNSVLVE